MEVEILVEDEENCEAAFNKLVNDTHVASQLTSVTKIDKDATSKLVNYSWICLINYGGWGLLPDFPLVYKILKLKNLLHSRFFLAVSIPNLIFPSKILLCGFRFLLLFLLYKLPAAGFADYLF